jgi:hypothetical protein
MFFSLGRLIKGPLMAYLTLTVVMYICSSFFWPTPATALVGTLLIPFAIRAGLPPLTAALAVNLSGHGMALSGDLILQGALKLTSQAANVPVESVFTPAAVLSTVSGLAALLAGLIISWKAIGAFANSEEHKQSQAAFVTAPVFGKFATFFAIAVPILFLFVLGVMINKQIRGGQATALLGGASVIVLVLASIAHDPKNCFDDIVKCLREGFLFGMKIFTPVIPIAAFFYLGADSAASILGKGAPPLLFDIGQWVSAQIPISKAPLAFGELVIGVITGLDGSGFSGLPLTGSLAAALAGPEGYNVQYLAILGQLGAIWAGGGCLVPWCFGLAATAGIAGVDPRDLARANLVPVGIGLFAAMIIAIVMM